MGACDACGATADEDAEGVVEVVGAWDAFGAIADEDAGGVHEVIADVGAEDAAGVISDALVIITDAVWVCSLGDGHALVLVADGVGNLGDVHAA